MRGNQTKIKLDKQNIRMLQTYFCDIIQKIFELINLQVVPKKYLF